MATLPFLPGYSFDRNSQVGKPHFPRSQIFGLSNNVAVVLDNKLNRPGDCNPDQRFFTFPNGEGPPVPAWIAFDKQALCFLAYWQEGISEMPHENYRVHKVKIIFFLEDDSIQIVNFPETVNTGLIPGIVNKNLLIRRHRIRMPPPNDEQFYNLEHIKIGHDIMIYGKVFRITGCGNSFTENFLRKIGRKIENSSTIPLDPGTERAKNTRESELMPLIPCVKSYKFRKFLEHDGQVLRFFAYWDDTESLYGDVRDLVILYFLADDTIEIREKIYPNSGQDVFPVLIRRRKLPKKISLAPTVPEKKEDYTLLNVLGTPGHGQYYMQDPVQAGVFGDQEFYKDSDLMIGSIINALGRKVVIHDCDDFTKNYYRTKYSIDDFRPLVPGKRVTVKKEVLPREIPPHNGFGSEDDSIQNVYSLIPKPPPMNFSKFIQLDRNKDERNILRYIKEKLATYWMPMLILFLFLVLASYTSCVKNFTEYYKPFVVNNPSRDGNINGSNFQRHTKFEVGKTYFPRSQIFGLSNNVAVVLDYKLNRTGDCDPDQKFSSFANGEGPPVPAWIAFDKQALCFLAYWQEGISEVPHENYRVHKVKIIFFLEDDSIQVVNFPETVNTGLIPGIVNKNLLIRRHRIRMPPPNDEKFYNLEHMKIGHDIMIYGKVFRITGCGNSFTENFLRKIERKIEDSSIIPLDPGTERAKNTRESELIPCVKSYKFRKFLEHDGQVLRFFACWDDTESLYGDVRDLVILYFLADDTIEIREKIYPNSGQDVFPVLIRRRKLPKKISLAPTVPEKKEDYTLLNVLGTPGHGQYYMQDPVQAGVFGDQEFYKDSDLMIGSIINALGRKVVIHDCDDFTKNYYRTKYSIDDFRPLVPGKRVTVKKEVLPREIPPHNGFGSEEDSIQNVYSLIPKPPPMNFSKFIQLDRNKDESNILRFAARFAKVNNLNKDRKFVINVFLSDDTVYVFEISQRNSGFGGGKFIDRMRIKKPITPNPPANWIYSEYYKSADFYIGASVTLNNFDFVIVNADEYCLKYSEDHTEEFPQSNVKLIVDRLIKRKLHHSKDGFVKLDPTETNKMDFNSFRYSEIISHNLPLCKRKGIKLTVPGIHPDCINPKLPKGKWIWVHEINETSMTVNWNVTKKIERLQFEFHYHVNGKSDQKIMKILDRKRDNYTLTNLKPCTTYKVCVMPKFCIEGETPVLPESCLQIKTPDRPLIDKIFGLIF